MVMKTDTNSLEENHTLNTLIDMPEEKKEQYLNRSLDADAKYRDDSKEPKGNGQRMKIEINHRPH